MSAAQFLESQWRELLALTAQHVALVAAAVGAAVAVGIPLGILLTRRASLKRPVLAVAGVLQTVPSLALFGFLIPLPFVGGIGARTAVVALALYALLPVIRNTVTGIEGVDRSVREAAEALGMTNRQILRQVELPLAAPVILAGVRVATVISVGVATIAAAVGAGGLGMYIFRGLRQNDNALILAGAIPAALLALAADWALGLLESHFDARSRAAREDTTDGRRRALARRIVYASLVAAFVAAGLVFWNLGRGGRAGVLKNVADGTNDGRAVRVCSKDFTESLILSEALAQTLEARGVRVERSYELGGNLCHDALVAGRLDAYPEYTGTSFTAILKHNPVTDPRAVYEQVRREYGEKFSLEVGPPLGFSNDFAILVRGDEARRLNLRTVSDAVPHARAWRAGFGQDFMSRKDGYEGFARAYGLRFGAQPREMDLSLTYRALAARQVDIIAGNSTDGLIGALDLFQLEDDRRYFPPYEAVIVFRRDALAASPGARAALDELGGALTTEEMRRLNYEVDGRKRAVAEVVREWREGKAK
ncbi:MAG TPA: ABC transporter permease/substrate-binding protein [Pyrinomonadaceae bacterium]|nr:ABC transporter permease/substrate-binding protein [Pyrinomonadaceae bacterium]